VPTVLRLRRGLVAALAVVALLGATARPVLACEMARAEASAAVGAPAVDAHAHHAVPSEPDAPVAPAAAGCDHLVSCAVMVAAIAPTIALGPTSLPSAAGRWVVEHHDAPVRALEPPPPRA
jgi:hypothetical protein